MLLQNNFLLAAIEQSVGRRLDDAPEITLLMSVFSYRCLCRFKRLHFTELIVHLSISSAAAALVGEAGVVGVVATVVAKNQPYGFWLRPQQRPIRRKLA
jgi:hypothetical protein